MGCISVAGIVGVVAMPSERFGALHGVAVIAASVPGFIAALVSIVCLALDEPRPRVAATLGATMLTTSIADFVMYVRVWAMTGPGPLALPAMQKVALALLLAWMISVALRMMKRERGAPPPPNLN
jgi:hypothetical protein